MSVSHQNGLKWISSSTHWLAPGQGIRQKGLLPLQGSGLKAVGREWRSPLWRTAQGGGFTIPGPVMRGARDEGCTATSTVPGCYRPEAAIYWNTEGGELTHGPSMWPHKGWWCAVGTPEPWTCVFYLRVTKISVSAPIWWLNLMKSPRRKTGLSWYQFLVRPPFWNQGQTKGPRIISQRWVLELFGASDWFQVVYGE